MEYTTTKSFMIAVGIIITIIIVSALLLVVNSVKDVYANVTNTNVDIKTQYESINAQYNTYGKATMNGVDFINTLRKYETNMGVSVALFGTSMTTQGKSESDRRVIINEVSAALQSGSSIYGQTISYNQKFKVKVEDTTAGTVIIFEI